MRGLAKLVLLVGLICACEAQSDPAPEAALEPAPAPDPAPGPGPAVSNSSSTEGRRQAVLALLTDGTGAESLPIAATAPGETFDRRLAEKLTPKVRISDDPPAREHGVPQVAFGQITIDGPLDKDLVRRVVRTHIHSLRACYDAGLDKNPKLAGRVVVEFRILPTGKVGRSTVASTTLSQAAVGNCFAMAIQGWVFRSPKDAELVDVSIPFDLSTES